MEVETIDLTDPLQELLKKTGWTPEYVLQRLEKLKEESVRSRSSNKGESDLITSLLENDKKPLSNRKTNLEASETIELSDDDEPVVTFKNEIIEIDDDDDDVVITNVSGESRETPPVLERADGLPEIIDSKESLTEQLTNIETKIDSERDNNIRENEGQDETVIENTTSIITNDSDGFSESTSDSYFNTLLDNIEASLAAEKLEQIPSPLINEKDCDNSNSNSEKTESKSAVSISVKDSEGSSENDVGLLSHIEGGIELDDISGADTLKENSLPTEISDDSGKEKDFTAFDGNLSSKDAEKRADENQENNQLDKEERNDLVEEDKTVLENVEANDPESNLSVLDSSEKEPVGVFSDTDITNESKEEARDPLEQESIVGLNHFNTSPIKINQNSDSVVDSQDQSSTHLSLSSDESKAVNPDVPCSTKSPLSEKTVGILLDNVQEEQKGMNDEMGKDPLSQDSDPNVGLVCGDVATKDNNEPSKSTTAKQIQPNTVNEEISSEVNKTISYLVDSVDKAETDPLTLDDADHSSDRTEKSTDHLNKTNENLKPSDQETKTSDKNEKINGCERENLDEVSSHKSVDSEDEAESDVKLSFEEIRKNLKMQLTSLRTRKNPGVLPMLGSNENKSITVLDEKSLERKLSENSAKEECKSGEPIKSVSSSELGFVISGVRSVADNDISPTDTQENESKTYEEHYDDNANDSVTNALSEIRKIIRKQKTHSTFGFGTLDSTKSLSATPEYKSLDLSAENSRSEIPPKTDNNSPFVSNSLDEFLTENSKLNVSYVVPKSGAEEGLRTNYDEVVPVSIPTVPVKEEFTEKPKLQAHKFKAKTLAEKRKLFERNRLRELKELKRMKKINDEQERSYVMYEDKKIWVRSDLKGKCIAEINSHPNSETVTTPRKLSLLDELFKRNNPVVKYRAGPLCKKPELQEDNGVWQSEVKTLPKIQLELHPEAGKPIWPNLWHLLPNCDGEITEDQIDFALTAVVSKGCVPEQKVFKYDVPYANNQEKIVIKKRVNPPQQPTDLEVVDDRSPLEKQVDGVIKDLINYVELKFIAPSLIKEDEDCLKREDLPIKTDANDKDQHLLVKRRRHKKRSKTDLELNRLNCKIVSVEIEDVPNEQCSKPHCKFGCVCNSLLCETFIGMHCRKPECMFGCSCPEERGLTFCKEKIRLPVGTNVLSVDTVSRIEDAAKRNLAKVEREFTQTIIHTSHKTIVVGSNKSRRATRTPKKYTDFFEDSDDAAPKSEQKDVVSLTNQVTPCSVEIQMMNLTDVNPLCLVHGFYDCHCNLTADKLLDDDVKMEPPDLKEVGVDTTKPKKIRKNNRWSVNKAKTKDADDVVIYSRKRKSNVNISDEDKSPSKILRIHCARTKGFSASHRKTKLNTPRAANRDYMKRINDAGAVKAKISQKKRLTDSDNLKLTLIDEENKVIEPGERKTKRKQVLEVRDEDLITEIEVQSLYRPVFAGEIIVNDREWLEKFGQAGKQRLDCYARILPWKALLAGFLSKSIRVYCVTDSPYKLLLTTTDKFPQNALNVETNAAFILALPMIFKSPWLASQCDNVKDMVRWLMTCSLPEKYSAVSLSFLLVETIEDMFEVRGLCTQNPKSCLQKPTNVNKLDVPADWQEVKHKDMSNEVKTLYLTKESFPLQELIHESENDVVEDASSEMYMWVGLPRVFRVCKWRMLPLNRDFAYLHFKDVKYSIKYTDLVKFIEMAKEAKCTLVIRNKQITNGYTHTRFGLYVDQSYSDRIFIGPYFKQFDNEDLETLRYINRSLVSSESFNKMRGNSTYKCGIWMVERPYHVPRRHVNATIDLTAEDDNVASTETTNPVTTTSASQVAKQGQVIFHNGVPIHIKNVKPKSPSEYNRFIITNIPKFGYLGAYQPDNSHTLEVSWPFEKKVLQFQNADHARDFLQDRFNQLLQPVPDTFKIQVIVLMDLDLNEYQPINSEFLTGHCVCGYFGTYNFRNITDEFCMDVLKMSKADITKLFAKRAHTYIKKKADDLAVVLGIKREDLPKCNIDFILMLAENEIRSLDGARKNHITTIEKLEKSVMENIQTLYDLMRNLPVKERSIESRVFNEILNIRPNRFSARETVEIEDDDDINTSPSSNSNLLISQESGESVKDKPAVANNVQIVTKDIKELQKIGFKIPAKTVKIAKVSPFQTRAIPRSMFRPIRPKPAGITPDPQSGTDNVPSTTQSAQPVITPNVSPKKTSLGVISPKGKLVKGMKVMKTADGKFLLVSESIKSLPGQKSVIIRNNHQVYTKPDGEPKT